MRYILAFLIIMMPGCASVPEMPTEFAGYCALKPISNDNGIMFVMAYCKAQE